MPGLGLVLGLGLAPGLGLVLGLVPGLVLTLAPGSGFGAAAVQPARSNAHQRFTPGNLALADFAQPPAPRAEREANGGRR